MFGIVHRPVYLRGPESDVVIASGKPWLCQDWQCPANPSCARHFGRSLSYWAMDDKHPALVVPYRGTYLGTPRGQCDHYKRDVPRPWIRDLRGNVEPVPD